MPTISDSFVPHEQVKREIDPVLETKLHAIDRENLRPGKPPHFDKPQQSMWPQWPQTHVGIFALSQTNFSHRTPVL